MSKLEPAPAYRKRLPLSVRNYVDRAERLPRESPLVVPEIREMREALAAFEAAGRNWRSGRIQEWLDRITRWDLIHQPVRKRTGKSGSSNFFPALNHDLGRKRNAHECENRSSNCRFASNSKSGCRFFPGNQRETTLSTRSQIGTAAIAHWRTVALRRISLCCQRFRRLRNHSGVSGIVQIQPIFRPRRLVGAGPSLLGRLAGGCSRSKPMPGRSLHFRRLRRCA
jgi:hypothetical protein